MSQLDHIPPEQMPEVLSAATRLYEAEREARQERKSAVDAAAELDIPEEYLERAAVQVTEQRARAVVRRRTRTRVIAGTVAAIAAIGVGWTVTHRPPLAPTVYTFSATSDQTWSPNVSVGSQATVTYPQVIGRGTVANIHIGKMQPAATGEYVVNFDTHAVPKSIAGYHTVTFWARGDGVGHVKVAFENGDERWRSTLLNVGSQWREYQLPLGQFEHQVRANSTASWHGAGTGAPSTAGRISFKLGQYVNDPSTTGDLQIDRIVLK